MPPLAALKPGAPAQERELAVNSPLQFGNSYVYLLGNGYAPTLTIRDAAGEVVYSESQPFLPQDSNMTSLGIIKAYTTRVGAGPFPTELFDKWGEYLQTTGGEIGVNTGRKRRCGWYDSVVARYATRVNGFTDYFLTKLDVLTGIGEIPICVAYDVDGKRYDDMPLTQSEFHHAEPIFETMPAWDEDITGCRTFDELPQKAQDYVLRLEELSGAPISYIGVGPGRDQTIVRHDVMEDQ